MDHFICIAFLLVYFSFIVNMAGGQAQQVGDCGGFEKKPSGSIQTPNYPLNYPEDKVCFWIIEVQAGDKVVLSFESFALEDHASCQYDYVLIRDGMSPRSPWIGTFCGTSRPATITSTDNYLWISFKSDSTATNQGFKAIWASEGSSVDFATTTSSTAATSRGTTVHGAVSPSPSTPRPTSSQTPHSGCGGQLTGEGGLFTSPNYPVSYPVNIQCVWRIVTKPTGSVELTFQDFHLENSGSCEFDFVEIRDGAMVDSPLIGTFCSSMIIGKIISTGNSLLVRLTSDSSVSEKGFNASWKLVSYTTSTTSMPPSSTPLSTTIRPVCGGTFTKMTGSMRSPHYPEDYPESVTCQWIIKLPVQYKVKLEFSDFLLENSESCRFDFVLVMDGLPSSPTPIGKFCGNGSKDAVESKSNFLTVLFKSDSSMTKKGFEAYWSAIPVFTEKPTSVSTSSKVPPGEIITTPPQCGGNPKKPSGDLFSPYYPDPSFEPVDCQWVLSVYEGNNISVGFNEFDLNSDENCNTEYVELRDGGLDSSKLLGRYCKSAPMIIYGSQNKMWMRYHSDGTGSRGFEVTWITMAQAIKPMESSEESNPSLIGPIPHPSKKCGDALGVESGEIKDAQLSASSSWRGIRTFGAQHARLNNQQWPQGWSADVRDKNPWLKVSLDVDHVITGIATQGHGSLVFSERVESYFVVWLDIRAGNVYYHEDGKVKIFVGNSDHDTVVRHVLKEPFITKQLTIRPITWKENVGLRMELYGCTLDTCQEPLGLENGNVKDGQLTASSAWSNDPNKFGAHRARLNLNRWPSGWTANAKDLSPWLQVNLNDPFIVTRVATQGYGGASDQWVETYRMSWKNGEGIWRNYSIPHRRLSTSKVQWKTKIFHGNKDRTSIVSHTLGNAIHSSTIRIWPLKKHNFISMRAELYGCLAEPSPSGTNCTRKGHRMSGESNPPYKMDCQWNVTSSTDKGAVILKFTSFDFSRSDPSCIKDYVEVRNGPTEDAPLIGKFCGGKAPSPVQSSGSSLWVRYVVSGKIQTKVEMTYHDDPDKENKLENEKGYQGCGTRVHTTPRSHLGGDTSKQWSGQWPWLVSLSLIGQSMQQCSGALIAPTWVLTAAHCFRRFKQPSQWVVRAGEFDLAVNEGYEQNVRAQSIHIHSQYKVETNENDIALVNLEKSVEINDKVSVLCLPHQGSVQPGASCVVAGWGFASNFHRSSTPLRSHTVPVVSRRTCNKVNSYAGLVKEKMICAGFEEGGDDRCYGDGGGPLMCKDSQGKWFVGGINSWGEGCGLRGKYGVFTLTESFRDWIDRYLRDNY